MKPRLVALFAIALLLLPFPVVASELPSAISDRLIVSPAGPYTTIEMALAEARDGDVIEVRGGIYLGLAVEKSVTLEGVNWPVIYGGEQGTVVTLNAPSIVFRGFEVRGSGVDPDHDDAGITVTAADVVVENNRLSDVLFGVFVAEAEDAVVRGNDITSKSEYASGRKGDAIRVWYSKSVVIENNRVHESRDVVMWYAEDVVLRGNVIESGRYGIHIMYCNGSQIERNRILNNSVGVYIMYSKDVVLHDNDIRGQRGPSGYALGFKDADNVTVTGNLVVDNRGGVFLDNTPFAPQSFARFEDNILAFNDVGVILLTAVHGNTFTGNTFWENVEQVALQGGGKTGENLWQNNYWSDYLGFDADEDGQGDTPYRAERLFESLTDREPALRALIYSPAAHTIEFAASAFPIVKPRPKLMDNAPRMLPAAIPSSAIPPRKSAAPMTLLAFGLLALGLVGGLYEYTGQRKLKKAEIRTERHRPEPKGLQSNALTRKMLPPMMTLNFSSEAVVSVENVAKRYGQMMALDQVSFAVRAGEALALWGSNGAGKTTLIKAMLGLIEFQGDIRIAGHDVRRDGKAARRCIGYVPQEANFYDMTVRATMEFYGRLKKTSPDRIPVLLEKLGLTEHAHKTVPALSGGLKQRLALAIALLADPSVLLLDEPTANLDTRARHDYVALLNTLRKENKTIIFASHRLEELESLADHVLVLDSGRVAERLTPATFDPTLPAADIEAIVDSWQTHLQAGLLGLRAEF